MKPKKMLRVGSSPFAHSGHTIDEAMRDVFLALLPAVAASIWFFRLQAVAILITAVITAVAAEYIVQKIRRIPVTTGDWSAALTGLLLGLVVPPSLPLWLVVIGSASAIVIAKQLFGGLGNNLFNPALVGRAILVASWPVYMTTWTAPYEAVSMATPLNTLNQYIAGISTSVTTDAYVVLPHVEDLLLGSVAGSLGETSALALLLGGLFLIWKGHIDWKIPVLYIGTVFGLSLVFNQGLSPLWYALYQVLSGGLILGAFFMATDWVTSPITRRGRIIYALGLGILTFLIRRGGGYPEGVLYSILLMNMATPLIDRLTKGRIFGAVKNNG